MRRDRDGPGETLHLDDLGGGGHLGGARGVGTGRPVHDRDEVVLGRERDQDLEEEPVELGLGEGIGPLHLERVLRRKDEEGRVEREALPGDGDLVLLHRLEQARLRLRGRPVDLVGEDEVGEDRALLEPEDPAAAFLDEDVRAGDVGRHQVGRELDPVERAVDDVRDRPDEHGLAEAWHALEQNVAVRQESRQRLPNELALADDDPTDLLLDRPRSFRKGFRGEMTRAWPGVRRSRGGVHRVLRVFGQRTAEATVTGSGRGS